MLNKGRERLKAAFAKRGNLEAKVKDLQILKEAARLIIVDVESLVALSGDLDAEIARFRIQAARRKQDPKKLSPELASRVKDQRDAEDELKHARNTLDLLESDITNAEQELRDATAEHSELVFQTVYELGAAIATRLVQINTARANHIAILKALAHLDLPEYGRNYMLGIYLEDWLEAINGKEQPIELPEGLSMERALSARWGERVRALMNDPSAEITEPRLVRPSDVVMRYVEADAFNGPHHTFDLLPEE